MVKLYEARPCRRAMRRGGSSRIRESELGHRTLTRELGADEAGAEKTTRTQGELMADESRNTPAKAGSSFKFDVKRWSQTDRIVAIATFVLFVSLFLSWFGAGIYVSDLWT
jgi:hypothetical protein